MGGKKEEVVALGRRNKAGRGEAVRKANGNKPLLAKCNNSALQLSGVFHLRLSELLRNIS